MSLKMCSRKEDNYFVIEYHTVRHAICSQYIEMYTNRDLLLR